MPWSFPSLHSLPTHSYPAASFSPGDTIRKGRTPTCRTYVSHFIAGLKVDAAFIQHGRLCLQQTTRRGLLEYPQCPSESLRVLWLPAPACSLS